MFAMGEAIAHLNYLEQARELKGVEENGVVRYVKLSLNRQGVECHGCTRARSCRSPN